MRAKSCAVTIGGEAGQGLVTVGSLLARLFVRCGHHLCVTQDYQSRIRGGHNTFRIRASSEPVHAPQEGIDLLIALNAETVALHRDALGPQGLIVADASHACDDPRCLAVPFKDLGSRRTLNIAALGVAASLLRLPRERCAEVVHDAFGKKDAATAAENEQALTRAFEWAADKPQLAAALGPAPEEAPRLMLNGNDAIALGALSAGIKFFAFYPMTPATSVGLNLAARAREMGIIVEQAEDEIAAINMAIGASFAGAPAMVATSGGGFALMVEAVSLAGMTETPVVICVGQRPAPATGLPTRTEQADLEMVLYAGHGEFPRAIHAPGTVEECFHLTRKAFFDAEASQGPVFLLTDQYLADCDTDCAPFDLEALEPVVAGTPHEAVQGDYQRYQLAPGGISPRLIPGKGRHLVVADSDEHTEDGHLTEDLGIRVKMVEKRLAKIEVLKRDVVPPEFAGAGQPELLLVCWGSTRGAVAEAVEGLNASGRSAAMLHFSQVWPLVPAQFLGRLQAAKQVVAVEGNATAQLARLIHRESGFRIERNVLRYDGLAITSEYILKQLER